MAYYVTEDDTNGPAVIGPMGCTRVVVATQQYNSERVGASGPLSSTRAVVAAQQYNSEGSEVGPLRSTDVVGEQLYNNRKQSGVVPIRSTCVTAAQHYNSERSEVGPLNSSTCDVTGQQYNKSNGSVVGPISSTSTVVSAQQYNSNRSVLGPLNSTSVVVRQPAWLRLLFFIFIMDIINCVTAKGLLFDHSGKLESSSQMWRHDWVQAPSYKNTPNNVTAVVGDAAYLPCTVHHLGDRSVTWMRQRDLHILTAGIFTYSADDRFRVLHPENTDEWTLHIQYTTLRDKGVYECQVNSDPKITRSVTLNVLEHSQLDDPASFGMQIGTTDTRFPDYIFDQQGSIVHGKQNTKKPKGHGGRKGQRQRKVPSVEVAGEATRYIQRGSVLAITCKVYHPPLEAPQQVLWFHGKDNIDYDSPRGGISIQSEKVRRQTVSKLMLSGVTEADTGEYHCAPTGMETATVFVHVQNDPSHGELTHPDGLTGSSSREMNTASICIITLLLVFIYFNTLSQV